MSEEAPRGPTHEPRTLGLDVYGEEDNQAAPNKNRRLHESQSAHQSPTGSSPNKANRKIPYMTGITTLGSRDHSMEMVEMEPPEDSREGEGRSGESNYNPYSDPGNTSMHANATSPDPFTTPPQSSRRAPADASTPNPRSKHLAAKVKRTFEPVPLYSVVKVGTLDEERTKGVLFGYDNPHGPLDFSGPPSSEIARRFRMSSLNEGYFQKAVFYPSDFMHQELPDTMSNIRTFLEEAGCEDLEINSPFYNDLNADKERPSGRGRGKPNWRRRGRGGSEQPQRGEDAKNDRYKGRNVAFALVQPPAVRTLILSLQTFALSNILAFHATEPSTENIPWVVCILFVTSTKADAAMGDKIEHTIRKGLATDERLARDLANSSRVEGTTSDKVQSFIDSTEVRDAGYESTEKHQRCHVWTLYAAPFANSESFITRDADERLIRKYISTKQFEMGTIDISGAYTECKLCKSNEHQTHGCQYRYPEYKNWKGPKQEIHKEVEEYKKMQKQTKAARRDL
ncbi:hypothetical protein F5877DRAFT_72815 [Lentinula edodes]|nr:hypothetical protein F5877DRAFT_72815 [Lentinula edodes]